jgi:hypothetical protein
VGKINLTFLIVLTATVLLISSFLQSNIVIHKVKAAVTTSVPQRVPVEYEWRTQVDQGLTLDEGAFKINLGKQTGTLVLKLYFTDQYDAGKANSLWLNTKNKHDGGYLLTDVNTGWYSYIDHGLAMFDKYWRYPYTPKLNFPAGFAGGDTNAKGEKYVVLGIYLNKVMNNGIYYLDMPNGMNKGMWDVKAYFYNKVNVEEQLFNQIGHYFPLLGKISWDGAELKTGQIGRLTVVKDTPLYKFDGDNKVFTRTLKAGETYRIYAFKPGMLSLGGGLFVDRDSNVKYQTPSKSKLQLVQMISE